MTTTLLPSSTFNPKTWSGGTTTEVFIFPPTTNYQQRNFDFRLSTATVEVETSVFTPLNGVSRILMVLDGDMKLIHEGRHAAELNKFDIDRFEGSWKTSSKGKCTDFNLMTMGQTNGDQMRLNVSKDESINHPIKNSWDWLFIYAYTGAVNIDINDETQVINKGDLLIIEEPTIPTIQLHGIENSDLVLCNISHEKI